VHKGRIFIAKKTLALLEKKTWDKIKLNNILEGQHTQLFKTKNDALININKYFDFLLQQNLSSLEKSSTKDMLFEVLMARLDILNIHRKSIKNLLNFFIYKPHESLRLIPSLINSVILIATYAGINVSSVQGILKVKSIFILYILIIFTWYNDETYSLERTMTTLDKYLNNIDKFLKLIYGNK
tara:strand:+ start:9560 stop:10108 length:549 start_codon:yes stop_codon:yes gene_type:complete